MTDLKRVCSLPTVDLLTESELEEISEYMILDKAYEEGFRLLPEQANMVAQFINYEGVFGCAAAGAGKTLTAQLITNLAYRGDYTKKYKKILYLLPSNLVGQLRTSIKWARKRIHFSVPFHYFSDYKKGDRITLSNTAGDGVYVLGYGLLSGKDTEEMIHNIEPDLIIADECHTLTNKRSARTRRVMHYLKTKPNTSLVLLSGTIVRKTIMEYHHLITFALKDNSPVPIPWTQAESLSIALVNSEGFVPSGQIRTAKPLADWAGEDWKISPLENVEVLRRSYSKRLRSAPGVFISDDDKVATSLQLNLQKARTKGTYGYEELKELVKQVEETWTTPSGDEFDFVLQKFKWVNELWQGFYNDLVWPEDHPKVDKAKEVHLLSNVLAKELRTFLGSAHRPHLDTPLLLRNDMKLHGQKNVPYSLYQAWLTHREAKEEGLPSRLSIPVRVSDFKVQAALEAWKQIEDGTGGIVWYYNNAYGQWLKEEFEKEYGDRVLYAPAGQKHKEAAQASKGKIVLASIEAHGTGTDGLQLNYHNNLVAQDLRTAKIAEQTIARTHRHGQKQDEMVFHILAASKYDDMQLSGLMQNSYFIHSTHTRQRLLTGTWLETPEHFSPEVLRAAGVGVVKEFKQADLEDLKELI
jgi:hypothetical protein